MLASLSFCSFSCFQRLQGLEALVWIYVYVWPTYLPFCSVPGAQKTLLSQEKQITEPGRRILLKMHIAIWFCRPEEMAEERDAMKMGSLNSAELGGVMLKATDYRL